MQMGTLEMNDMSRDVLIETSSKYIGKQAKATDSSMFVFSYTVNITNTMDQDVRLLSRYWLITNGDGQKVEVQGDGVVGEQPLIKPGETFSYSSASMLKTEVGTMEGYYRFEIPNSEQDAGQTSSRNSIIRQFTAAIPVFNLNVPNSLH